MKKALFGRLDVGCHQDSWIMLPEGFERAARAEFQRYDLCFSARVFRLRWPRHPQSTAAMTFSRPTRLA
jgi:hypothetical protein